MEEDIKPENAWQTTKDFDPDAHAGRSKQIKAWLRGAVPKEVL
jgi:hypothetical protein